MVGSLNELETGGRTRLVEVGGSGKGNPQFLGADGQVLRDENLVVLGFVQKTDQK